MRRWDEVSPSRPQNTSPRPPLPKQRTAARAASLARPLYPARLMKALRAILLVGGLTILAFLVVRIGADAVVSVLSTSRVPSTSTRRAPPGPGHGRK